MKTILTDTQIENNKKWLEALRSGKYSQGRNALIRRYQSENKPQYCCLGVSCVIQGVHENLTEHCASRRKFIFKEGRGDYSTPDPNWFIETYGYSFMDPHDGSYDLMSQNDVGNRSFENIANDLEHWLEENTNFKSY